MAGALQDASRRRGVRRTRQRLGVRWPSRGLAHFQDASRRRGAWRTRQRLGVRWPSTALAGAQTANEHTKNRGVSSFFIFHFPFKNRGLDRSATPGPKRQRTGALQDASRRRGVRRTRQRLGVRWPSTALAGAQLQTNTPKTVEFLHFSFFIFHLKIGGLIVWPRPGQSARGLAHSKTLRAGGACGERASVLECGGPPPLWLAPNCKRTHQKPWSFFIFHFPFKNRGFDRLATPGPKRQMAGALQDASRRRGVRRTRQRLGVRVALHRFGWRPTANEHTKNRGVSSFFIFHLKIGGLIVWPRPGQSARWLAHSKTLRAGGACDERASVLECVWPSTALAGAQLQTNTPKTVEFLHFSFFIFHLKIGGLIVWPRPGQSARWLAHSKTLRAGGACDERASVLECGGPPPLWLAPNCKRTHQKPWRFFIFHFPFSI